MNYGEKPFSEPRSQYLENSSLQLGTNDCFAGRVHYPLLRMFFQHRLAQFSYDTDASVTFQSNLNTNATKASSPPGPRWACRFSSASPSKHYTDVHCPLVLIQSIGLKSLFLISRGSHEGYYPVCKRKKALSVDVYVEGLTALSLRRVSPAAVNSLSFLSKNESLNKQYPI